jgi:hypothetical protein
LDRDFLAIHKDVVDAADFLTRVYEDGSHAQGMVAFEMTPEVQYDTIGF